MQSEAGYIGETFPVVQNSPAWARAVFLRQQDLFDFEVVGGGGEWTCFDIQETGGRIRWHVGFGIPFVTIWLECGRGFEPCTRAGVPSAGGGDKHG